ncbi:MAG: Vi polysaccharide biosynthesis UDP-N-acetylglucosamine C-6 dehydrogenase TviB [Methylococcales bacterium]
MIQFSSIKLAVIGLGYVGVPLALAFARKFDVLGYDINLERISELKSGKDSTLECSEDDLSKAIKLKFSANRKDLNLCNVYIVTVPTPIDKNKTPDLEPLIKACRLIGKVLNKNNVVIFESTVYPGATEEECVPVLEHESGLTFNIDFFVGYSPERINPGDKNRPISTIKKVTSGSTLEASTFVDELYQKIIIAGTHKASSIKVAEAAKVIENTQRDINIALINELSLIFNKLNIDTEEVLIAAGTKWNFLPFRPGLVGGHCIGVDPYYLTHKAQEIGYIPEMILAGRNLNDQMGIYVVSEIVKLMLGKNIDLNKADILIMGLTFKENCPDIRNTRVIDIVNECKGYGINTHVYDPWVNKERAYQEYGIELLDEIDKATYDAIVLAVAHTEFIDMGADALHELGKNPHVIYDIKYILNKNEVDGRL